jgi:regulation of enolase protein 1 (concanavalin A-like superfamily)
MFDTKQLVWTREPQSYSITDERIEIITAPHTDLWQRTYYHFRNDNAPVLQMECREKFFSFTVKTEFESKRRFDQCGIVMYLDSENWLKASIEYENEDFQHLGSVVQTMVIQIGQPRKSMPILSRCGIDSAVEVTIIALNALRMA